MVIPITLRDAVDAFNAVPFPRSHHSTHSRASRDIDRCGMDFQLGAVCVKGQQLSFPKGTNNTGSFSKFHTIHNNGAY
jgi:hypothetical protein